MDPVGFIASVGTILGAVFEAIKILNNIREGEKQRLRLLTSISSLWTALLSVQANLYTDSGESTSAVPESLKVLQAENGVFYQVENITREIEAYLKPSRPLMAKIKWPFTKTKVEEMVSDMERLTSAVNLALSSYNMETLREVRKLTHGIESVTMRAEFKTLLQWISSYDFIKQQHDLHRKTSGSSGRWFLNDPSFRSWKSNMPSTLWCPGIPGAGKTHLAAIVYDHLSNVPDTLTLVLYCGYVDPPDQTRDNFLRMLIRQIIQKHPSYGNDLREVYRANSTDNMDHLSIFRDLLSKLKHSFIIIDALNDVVEESQRHELLEAVISSNTNALVTSRPVETIRDLFCFDSQCQQCHNEPAILLRTGEGDGQTADICETCFNVAKPNEPRPGAKLFNARRLDIQASDQDLRDYIFGCLDQPSHLSTCVGQHESLRHEIVNTVVRRAEGMFLLTKLYMDALAPKRTPKAVRKALQQLPSGVNDTYDQVLRRINPLREETNEDDSKYAMSLLRWMTFARRPLTKREVEHAVRISFDISDVPRDEDCLSKIDDVDADEVLSASELTSMCAGLVIIDANDKVLWVHFTTQDYFHANSARLFPEAHLYLARACLTYLSMEPFREGSPSVRSETGSIERLLLQYPFMTYSSTNLGWHGQKAESEDLRKSFLNFLRTQGLMDSAVQILGIYGHERLAAYWGLPDVIEDRTKIAKSPKEPFLM